MKKSLFPFIICLLLSCTYTASGTGMLTFEVASKNANSTSSGVIKDTIDGELFYIVEEMPTFQGKEYGAFNGWLAENLKYPSEAVKDSITGKVYVQFVINTKGNMADVTVVRGIHPLLDKEALRVIKSSPGWGPGKQRGIKVCVQLTFPVIFNLE